MRNVGEVAASRAHLYAAVYDGVSRVLHARTMADMSIVARVCESVMEFVAAVPAVDQDPERRLEEIMEDDAALRAVLDTAGAARASMSPSGSLGSAVARLPIAVVAFALMVDVYRRRCGRSEIEPVACDVDPRVFLTAEQLALHRAAGVVDPGAERVVVMRHTNEAIHRAFAEFSGDLADLRQALQSAYDHIASGASARRELEVERRTVIDVLRAAAAGDAVAARTRDAWLAKADPDPIADVIAAARPTTTRISWIDHHEKIPLDTAGCYAEQQLTGGEMVRWWPAPTDDKRYADGVVIDRQSMRIDYLSPRWRPDDGNVGDVVRRPNGRIVNLLDAQSGADPEPIGDAPAAEPDLMEQAAAAAGPIEIPEPNIPEPITDLRAMVAEFGVTRLTEPVSLHSRAVLHPESTMPRTAPRGFVLLAVEDVAQVSDVLGPEQLVAPGMWVAAPAWRPVTSPHDAAIAALESELEREVLARSVEISLAGADLHRAAGGERPTVGRILAALEAASAAAEPIVTLRRRLGAAHQLRRDAQNDPARRARELARAATTIAAIAARRDPEPDR